MNIFLIWIFPSEDSHSLLGLVVVIIYPQQREMKIYSMVPQKEYIYYLFSFIAPLFKSFAKEGLLLSGPGFFTAVSSPRLWKFWPKKCSDCRRRAAHCDWLPRSKMLSNHFIILTLKMCLPPFSSSPLVRLRNLNVVTLLVDHHLHAGHHGIRVSARLGAGTGWP